MATNVPQPFFGPQGFVSPPESAIEQGRMADLNSAFGGNLNPDLTTPQGQLATSDAAIIGDVMGQFTLLTNQVDPAFSSGRFQDAIGRIYMMHRIVGTASMVNVICGGVTGTFIPAGSLIKDTAGHTWASTTDLTIGAPTGSYLMFICTELGAVTIPGSTDVIIDNPGAISGWTNVTAEGGVLGSDVESRLQFERRRQLSVQRNAMGMLGAIRAEVLAVPNVIDVLVAENTTSGTLSLGGVPLNANSLYVCVAGGPSSQAVGEAIWRKKNPGCSYTGATSVTVHDNSYPASMPPPAYTVQYQPAWPIPQVIRVSLFNSPAAVSNAIDIIRDVVMSVFYGADATFTGTISADPTTGKNTVLTVSAVQQGSIQVGQFLFSQGISATTAIVSNGSGGGGPGTYNLSVAQASTLPSQTMNTGPINALQAENRATIGATILGSSYVPAILALGWPLVADIEIANAATGLGSANFSGTMTANSDGTGLLTVTVLNNGALGVAHFVFGQGVPSGCKITALGTGTGGLGTYTVAVGPPANITTPTAMLTLNPNTDYAANQFNEIPTLARENIDVVLGQFPLPSRAMTPRRANTGDR